MKRIITIILILVTTNIFAVTRTTTSSGSFTSELWSPAGTLQDGDTLIINHPTSINGTINTYSNTNVVIYVNAPLTFGNPSFLKLGDESVIHINAQIIVSGDNQNDKLKIGDTIFNETDLENLEINDILTEDGVLPVELLYFTANLISNDVLLEWTTASEINNDYFLIEKSKDGTNWNKVHIVNGHGNTTLTTKYKSNDTFNGDVYYRLWQTDYDGTTVLLSTVLVVSKVKIHQLFLINNDEKIISYHEYDLIGRNSNDVFKVHVLITNKRKYTKKTLSIK